MGHNERRKSLRHVSSNASMWLTEHALRTTLQTSAMVRTEQRMAEKPVGLIGVVMPDSFPQVPLSALWQYLIVPPCPSG